MFYQLISAGFITYALTMFLLIKRKYMEESSERLVRLEQHDEMITTVDDVVIQITTQDLALTLAELYDGMMVDVEELLLMNVTYNQIRELFLSYSTTPSGYSDFIGLPEEECERPRPPLRKARRRRDPLPRVSRWSSQVSPPVYLRHRFLPPSRKDYSSRRQR